MVLIFKVFLYGVRAPTVQCTTVAFNKVTHQHFLALIHVCLGVNMWNNNIFPQTPIYRRPFKVKPWCTNEQCWIVYGENFQHYANYSGLHFNQFSFLFFAQSMSSAFFWISVKFIVTLCCVLSGGWHWMMTSEMYTYAVIQELRKQCLQSLIREEL